MERHPCAPEREDLAVADCLRRGGEGLAVTQAHQVERLLRGEHRAVAGARMIGMTMRDHSLVHGPCGVDMETADFAVHAGRRGQENIFGAHWLEIWCNWRNDRWARCRCYSLVLLSFAGPVGSIRRHQIQR